MKEKRKQTHDEKGWNRVSNHSFQSTIPLITLNINGLNITIKR